MPKISLNVEKNLLKWFDRFVENEDAKFTRTQTIETDVGFYYTVLKIGMRQVVETLTYDEFVSLLGGFNGSLYSGQEGPETIAGNVHFYIQYEPEFEWNSNNLDVDKEQLLKKLEGFSEIQWYGLLEWARRFWHQGGGTMDGSIKKIGLDKEFFAS